MKILINLPEPEFETGDGRILKKKVEVQFSTIIFSQDIVKLQMQMVHTEGESVVADGFFAPREIPERSATNSNTVDKRTGMSADTIEEEHQIGEYEYFAKMKRSEIQSIQNQLIADGIELQFAPLPDDDENEQRMSAICEIQVLQLWQKGIFL